MSEIITALFVTFIFFAVAYAIILIGLISLFGIIRAIHTRRINEFIIHFIVFSFIYTGTGLVLDAVNDNSASAEVNVITKEQFINQVVFPEENIAIERIPARNQQGHSFHVMQESDMSIYYVDVYDEEAFGLYRYTVEPFNEDAR